MANTPHHNVRVPDDVWQAALGRAHSADSTLTSVIVAFLRAYGKGHIVTYGPIRVRTGRILTTADLDVLVAEAERGCYDVDELAEQPKRRHA